MVDEVVPGSSPGRAAAAPVGCRAEGWTSVARRLRNCGAMRDVEREMRPPRIASLLAFVALAASACASAAPPDDAPAAPVETTAMRDGISVALAVDQVRIPPGGDVTASVLVGNAGPGPVTWQGGGCELQGTFSVTPVAALPQVPPNPVVLGDGTAVIRQLALPDAYAIRWPTPPEFAHADLNWGCPANLAFNELLAGDQVRATVVWVASTAAGSPAPAGEYVVEVAFPFIARGLANVPLDFQQARDVKPIKARIVVTVEAGAPVPSPDVAIDAILADRAFGAALEQHPRRIWESVAFRWIDGGWVVQVRYTPGGLLEGRLAPGGAVLVRDGLSAAPAK